MIRQAYKPGQISAHGAFKLTGGVTEVSGSVGATAIPLLLIPLVL
jgi:hypothetical protein